MARRPSGAGPGGVGAGAVSGATAVSLRTRLIASPGGRNIGKPDRTADRCPAPVPRPSRLCADTSDTDRLPPGAWPRRSAGPSWFLRSFPCSLQEWKLRLLFACDGVFKLDSHGLYDLAGGYALLLRHGKWNIVCPDHSEDEKQLIAKLRHIHGHRWFHSPLLSRILRLTMSCARFVSMSHCGRSSRKLRNRSRT